MLRGEEIMKFDTRSLEALEGSIQKWGDIRDGDREDLGASNCPLCSVFFLPDDAKCGGCPVAEATGTAKCEGTPYDDWETHHERNHDNNEFALARRSECPECRRLADEEIKFLKSLRP